MAFLNLTLPLVLTLGCLITLTLRLHLITRVTPRIDRINGYQTTRKFKINFHQNTVYRRCFLNADQQHRHLFMVGDWDLCLFRIEKYLARSIVILFPLGCSFLTYAHTFVI